MCIRRVTSLIMVALLVITGCGGEFADQPPAPGTDNEPIEVTDTHCQPVAGPISDGVEVVAHALTADGRQLSLRREVLPAENDTLRINTSLRVDGELLMSSEVYGDANRLEVRVEYGALAPGVDSSHAVVENGVIHGTIDNRPLKPVPVEGIDAGAVVFENDDLLPELGIDADIEAALIELIETGNQSASTCAAPGNSTPGPSAVRQAAGDAGHDSDPEASAACAGCWAGCSAGAAVCIGGVSVACILAGPAYAVCEAAGVLACVGAYIACVDQGCYNEGPCCPVSCGEVACCGSGETCLNAQIGLCCSPGQTPCAGESCCDSTEICIAGGPEAGTCCEPENLCGDTCCGELETCNTTTGTCCGFNSQACGDTCCAIGEVCVTQGLNGSPFSQTCCPADRACGDTCCPDGSGCVNGSCTECPNPGDHYCPESGSCCPAGWYCTTEPGTCCPPGEIWCGGACMPMSHCIR